jgi:hypothetical protein
VGAGLKTVSLRLRGTESAKKELEESGEDVTDYTTNVSKLRESLIELSKVSANNFEGFDILRDDGSYKSTYQILLGIGKIWKDIGREQGDLAQANMLEKMFGKNRAQIGAAILQNPDILESAYNDSKYNSLNSAQNELDTYLASTEAKIKQLQETYNQLWSNTLSSDFVNSIIEAGTAILSLVDNVGLLQTALAGLSIFGASKGVG